MQLEDLATEVLQQARRLGASAGDVLIAVGEAFSAGVRLGEVEKVHNAREKRMGIRLFVGHSSAITSTANSPKPVPPRVRVSRGSGLSACSR